jgi:hypothetical protein
MDFEARYPEYLPVAEYVRRAQLERSVYIAHWIADLPERIGRGLKALGGLLGRAVDTDREWRALEAESLARHAAKRY